MKKYILIIVTSLFMVSCGISGPLFVTDNPTGSKEGKATAKFFMGYPIDGGDMSISTACKNGNITKVATVDVTVESGFFITRYTTVVTGE
jgi:hypothetical protein